MPTPMVKCLILILGIAVYSRPDGLKNQSISTTGDKIMSPWVITIGV